MTDFKANAPNSISAGAPPQIPLEGAYSAPPDLLAVLGAALRQREELGWGRGGKTGGRGKWRGGKGRAPKLLLNQGPSESCYATAQNFSR